MKSAFIKFNVKSLVDFLCTQGRMIGGILFFVPPVCLSVCLLSNLTFAITFEP